MTNATRHVYTTVQNFGLKIFFFPERNDYLFRNDALYHCLKHLHAIFSKENKLKTTIQWFGFFFKLKKKDKYAWYHNVILKLK